MEALSETIVESEEAHFRANPALRLKGPRLKAGGSIPVPPELALFQAWLFQNLEEFQKIHRIYVKNGRELKSSWGFLFFKCLILNTAELITERKEAQKPLRREQIVTLLAFLRQNQNLRHYLKGAKLSMLLESEDALSDAELFYLTQQQDSSGFPEALPGPMQSYHEKLAQDILEAMRRDLSQKPSGITGKGAMTAACCLLLPLFGMLF